MKVTFLVSMDVEPERDLVTLAAEVSDRLEDQFAIITVKPWQRPKTAPSAASRAVLRSFITLPH